MIQCSSCLDRTGVYRITLGEKNEVSSCPLMAWQTEHRSSNPSESPWRPLDQQRTPL